MEVTSADPRTTSVRVPITEPSLVGEARRGAVSLAGAAGLDEDARGRLAILTTELANNVVTHGGHGELLLRQLDEGGIPGVEVLALDKGPGIADVDRALRDGYSTAGTPGTGLGAVSRLADEFDLFSAPGLGTAVVARLWARPRAASLPPAAVAVGAVSVPKPHQEQCGDTWEVVARPSGETLVMVADGLGHGPQAAAAAREAARILRGQARRGPREIVEVAHIALRSTRGAAMAVAEVAADGGGVRFAGIGNIAAVIELGVERRNLVSHNGTVGHELRRVQEFDYPWSPGALLVMCSDGLATGWRLDAYPGLTARDPAVVAGVLYRDFVRGRDDATVVVARARGADRP
jgi:anti-sigma regulatory factor (Ser/Thr protein kinase)